MLLSIRTLRTYISLRAFVCVILSLISVNVFALNKLNISTTGSSVVLGDQLFLIEDVRAEYTWKTIIDGEHDYQWIQSLSSTPNYGYTDSVFWYRIQLDNPTSSAQKKLLSISYPLLDDIQIKLTDLAGKEFKSAATGDTKPVSTRELFHRGFLFNLEFPPNESRILYIRIETQGAQQLPVELWNEREFFVKDQQFLMITAMYFGMMLVMILFNLFIYASLKERVYLYYVGFILSFVVVQSSMSGFAALYLWPSIPYLNGISILFFVPATMAFSIMFGIEFLNLKERLPYIYKILKTFAILNFISCGFSFILPYSISTRTSVAMVVPISLTLLSIGPILWAKGVKEARYYTLAWVTFVIGTALVALNKYGLIPRNIFTEHGLVIGSALEAVLLSIALADRFNREREARYQAQKEKFEEAQERQRIEEQMLKQSTHSPLTKLPNKVMLNHRIEHLLKHFSDDNFSFAVVLIHLKRFHEVNKTLGHQIADELLVSIANKLQNLSQSLGEIIAIDDSQDSCDWVANIEGVTFAVLLRGNSPENTYQDIEIINQQIMEPIEYNGLSIDVGVSLGVAFYPTHGENESSLLRHAHIALDMADKEENNIAIYSKEMNPYNARRLSLMGELRKAIDEDQLQLFFQPQIELANSSVYGVEALLRWEHPTYGFIPPDEFVSLAERTGLIKSLTQWVINKAILFVKQLESKGHNLCVSINVSAINLQESHFDISVAELINRHQVQPSNILFEITETSVMNDEKRCFKMMEKLHHLGVKLSVDDFGTGQSSLAYIKKLPVEEIKVDRSFIMEMDKNQDDEVIVKTMINMCHTLGYKVVAEGVENEDIITMLKNLSCDFVQGYHISRPISGPDLLQWLDNTSYEPLQKQSIS